MKKTNLMRILESPKSRVFSRKLNKAFDDAITNGEAVVEDDDAVYNVASMPNGDVVVEDVENDELTKFSDNPEVEGDMVMEPIVEETVTQSRVQRRQFNEFQDSADRAAIESDPLRQIDTLPAVEVSVTTGITDENASGTKSFSIKYRNITDSRLMSKLTRAISRSFDDTVEEGVTPEDLDDLKTEIKETIKTESRRSKLFSDAPEANTEITKKLDEMKDEITETIKTESRITRSRNKNYSDGNDDKLDTIITKLDEVCPTTKTETEPAVDPEVDPNTDPEKAELDPKVEIATESQNREFSAKVNTTKTDSIDFFLDTPIS